MRRVVALVTVTAAVVAAAASAAPQRNELVRPGVSVGKIKLGMTDAQLRRAMGKPTYTLQHASSFGRRVIEYQFGATANYVARLAGPRGDLRVVSTYTVLRSERLPNGFGVGTQEVKIRRTYGSKLQCDAWDTFRQQSKTYITGNRECRLPGPRGSMTVFVSTIADNGYYTPADIDRVARVFEIGVRKATR